MHWSKHLALLFIFSICFVLMLLFIDCHTAPYPKIQVNSASMNSLTINNTKLTSNWNIALSFSNPTFFEMIYFDDISVYVFYKDSYHVLNESTFPSFTTGVDDTSFIQMNPSVNEFVVSGVTNGIEKSLHQYGMVQFGIDVSASIKFRNNVFHSGWKNLEVTCYPLKFQISSNANNTASGFLSESLRCSESN